MNVIVALFLAIVLLVFMRLSWYALRISTHSKPWHHYVLRIFPMIELALWIVFIYWAVETLFYHNTYYAFIIVALTLILILAISWFILRDLITGVLLKASYAFENGQFIQTAIASGTIISVGYTSLELQTMQGELIKIPYIRLYGQDIRRHAEKGQGKNQTLHLMIPQKHGAHNIQQIIKKRLLEMPWVLAGSDIAISLHLQDDCYEAEITFQSMYEDMLPRTEEIMRSFIEEVFPGKN